jgi:hypothetical protein
VRQICVALEAAGVEFTNGGQPGVRMAQSNILMTATEFQTGIQDVKESCLLRRIPGLSIETLAASFARLTIDGGQPCVGPGLFPAGARYRRRYPKGGGALKEAKSSVSREADGNDLVSPRPNIGAYRGLRQEKVKKELQGHLDESRKLIVDYFVPRVAASPPDAMRGQLLTCGEAEARIWLECELDRVFPKADALIQKMQLDVRYKDVTFETLNQEDFLDAIKEAFPRIDWDKAYQEFRAAGEKET